MTNKQAHAIAGTLGKPSKMPGRSYGISAWKCITGDKLAKVSGSVCWKCYARKGNYQFKRVRRAHAKRLRGMAKAGWVAAMVQLIGSQTVRVPFFRWHDSGDLQSIEHLHKIVDVAERLPRVAFWLPTREYAMVNAFKASGRAIPGNLTVRVSAHMIDGPVPDMGLPVSSVRSGDVVPEGAKVCPAPKQGNSCGECRACWDRQVAHVSYHEH